MNPITISRSRLCADTTHYTQLTWFIRFPFPHAQTWEFTLGLLMFVAAVLIARKALNSNFKNRRAQWSNKQRGVKPYLPLSLTENLNGCARRAKSWRHLLWMMWASCPWISHFQEHKTSVLCEVVLNLDNFSYRDLSNQTRHYPWWFRKRLFFFFLIL